MKKEERKEEEMGKLRVFIPRDQPSRLGRIIEESVVISFVCPI
jgi:hypothetical protein